MYENVGNNIFEIWQNFKIVSKPIFRPDSKSVLHFVIPSTLALQIQKRHTNYIWKHSCVQTLQYDVL